MNFDKYVGQKVLVNEGSETIELFGKEEAWPTYEISEDDTVIAEIRKEAGANPVRVWLPSSLGTMDVQSSRLNVMVVKQPDGTFEITTVYFG